MSRLLRMSSRRWALQHPLQLGLAVLGVALGIAVVLGVDLALESARTGFRLSTESVMGPVTHQVLGGPRGLSSQSWDVVEEIFPEAATPVAEGPIVLRDVPLRLFGVAIPADAAASRTARDDLPFELELDPAALLDPSRVALVLTVERAQRLGLSLGDPLAPTTSTGQHPARLAGLATIADELQRRALDDRVLTDLETATRLLGHPGRLTRIDLTLPAPPDAATLERLDDLRASLPAGARLISAQARRESALRMTQAFELNLRALALLALLCGSFLVYGTITFSVVERRPQIGLLRALGVSRRAVLTRVLVDVATLAALGTALGALGGIGLAHGLVRLVTRTVSDLYFATSVRRIDLDPWSLLQALGLGLGLAIVAGLRPALEATRVAPRLSLRSADSESAGSRRALAAAVGATMLAAGALGLALAGRNLVASFGTLFVAILGFSLLVPTCVALVARALEPLVRGRGIATRMAARGMAHSLGRTGVALSALTLAVATTIGIGVMVSSFRDSVSVWLGDTLRQDLYVSAALPSPDGGGGERVPWDPALLATVRALPGVASIHTVRRVTVDSVVEGSRGSTPEAEVSSLPTEVTALDTDRSGFDGYRLLGAEKGAHDRLWTAFSSQGAALISEPLAYHRELAVGDPVTLETDRGPITLAIVGIYRDYSTDRGEVLLHRATWDRYFDDPRIDGASIQAAEGMSDADLEELRDRVAAALPASPPFDVRSARGLRSAALDVFDRTFLITGVLRLLAGIIAFLGVLSALLALLLERRRHHAVLRALGLSGRELRNLLLLETSALGVIAGLLAVPLGLGLAWAMIHILNRRSFGWSMEMSLSPELLVQGVGLAWLAAFLAGLLPARQLLRSSPAPALRAD